MRAGETLALVGLNGAGKTTLIKGLLDFIHLDTGEARIFGCSSRKPSARAGLVYLPERFAPQPFLTGADFLRLAAELHGEPWDGAAARRACAELALEPDALTRPVSGYSKGMAQKLGLVACLLSQKPLLVLDEPMSGLDPQARALLKGLLTRHREAGRTLFYSTHLLADVEALSDRMAILHQGELRFLGSAAECCERFAAADLEQAFLGCVEGASPGHTPQPMSASTRGTSSGSRSRHQ